MFAGKRPPDGWTIDHGRLEEVTTIAGYLQRGCAVRGNCYQRDCRRRVSFDFGNMIKNGQGLLRMTEIQHTHRCGRLEGCAINWVEEPSLKPTLGMVAGRDHIAVEVRCIGRCKSPAHVTTVAAMIARLQDAKTGGPDTELKRLADAIPTPCPKCKGRYWRVEILWFDPSGARRPSWKADLDRRLEEARFRKAGEPMAPGPPVESSGRVARTARG